MTDVSDSPDPADRAVEKTGRPRFSDWLRAMAEHAGVAEPALLHQFLMEQGCQCTSESTADWLAGADPSYEKSRDIIKAFHTAFPELEVWEQYRRFVKGEPYLQAGSSRASHISETLDEILEKSGLPPGLFE